MYHKYVSRGCGFSSIHISLHMQQNGFVAFNNDTMLTRVSVKPTLEQILLGGFSVSLLFFSGSIRTVL